MDSRQRADPIDARVVFKVYAALMGAAGLALSGWGQRWLGQDLASQAWGKAALIRVSGSILIAAACFAAALASVEDPLSRRRGLVWFTAGHAAVFFAVLAQRYAICGPGLADWVAVLLLTAVAVFIYVWSTAAGDPPEPVQSFISLFAGSTATTERLRSAYEQQIRQAARQEERNRLARDLHDSIKQQIFVIQTAAATVQARFDQDPSGARQALEQVRHSAREAMTEMEVMLEQLRAAPLENTGLVEALKKQCEALGFRTGARVEFTLGKLPPSSTLTPGAQQAICRVAQEALANVARHARAGNVLVTLGIVNAQVALKIQDDGAGFDPNYRTVGMGIVNMRARAEESGGTLELASRPGGGTSVTLLLPYHAQGSPGEYRLRALIWGVILAVHVVLLVWTQSGNFVPVAGIAAIGFSRELVAYLRTRRESEGYQ